MSKSTTFTRTLALVLAFLISQPAWMFAVISAPELPDPGHVSVSREQQIQVGRQAVAEVYKQMPVLPDSSPVTQYVQRLGRRLVAVIPQQYSWPYEFHVVQQKEINAFALPGGPIFINVGTIEAADNEAELAGVMSHEMSHVYMQHSAKQASKSTVPQAVGVLGSVLGAVLGGTIGSLAQAGIQLGAGAVMLKYSREDEAQADAVGAIIMYKADFNPKAMAQFFQKLEQQGGAGGPQFLSDHPNPGNRMASIEKEIANWPAKNYLGTSQEFVRAKQDGTGVRSYSAQEIANGAKQGTWARQNSDNHSVPANVPVSSSSGSASSPTAELSGVSWSQVQPSGRFTQFQQGGISMSYPDNWKVYGQSQNTGGSSLVVAPPAGISQNAIACGVLINGAQDPNAGSLDQATQDLIANLQRENAGLRISNSPQAIQVNGVEGRSVYLTGQSPVQRNGRAEAERDWLVTLPLGNGLVYLVFIAPQSDFNRLQPTYRRMLESFQMQ